MYEYTVNGQQKKAVLLAYKGHNYCDAITTYFFEGEEGVDAANQYAREINDARVHQFCDYANVQIVPCGAVLEVVEPYDD